MDIRSKKNNFKKWLFDGHSKIYLAILCVLVIFIVIAFSNLKWLTDGNQQLDEDSSMQHSNNAYEEEKSSSIFIPDNDSYRIRINKAKNFITVYKIDIAGEFTTPYKTFRCSVNSNVTLGINQISEKFVWRKLADNQYAQYTSRINSTTYIHSVPYKSENNSTLNTAAYNNLGNTATVGSIYLEVSGAKWIYENCGFNTKVEIYEDLGEEPVIEFEEKSTLSYNAGYDPSDIENNSKVVPGSINYLRGVVDKEIPIGTEFNEWEGIYASDKDNNNITSYVTINGTVNTKETGSYKLTYNLIDKSGTVIAYTRTITVY